MSAKSQLVKIATEVREWAEDWNKLHDMFSYDLCGMCAIAAAELHRALVLNGYEPLIIVSEDNGACHCFVVCDGYLLDVTATQFGEFYNEPVVVLPYNKSTKSQLYHYGNPTYILENSHQLKVYQRTEDWPTSQVCF